MASETVSAGEFNDLAARYEALERQANNLLAAMSRGRAIRNILLFALLVLVAALVYTLYQMGNRLSSPKFMAELTDRAMVQVEKNGPAVQKHLLALYETSSPVLAQAFKDRAEKDQPKYVKKAEEEWPKLQKGLHERLEEQLLEQYKKAIADVRPELEAMCPELKSDPRKYDELEKGLVGAAERSIDKTIVKHIDPRFQKVDVNWRTYPAAPKPRDGDPSVGMQLVGHLLELLGTAFSQGDALAAMIEVPSKKPVNDRTHEKAPAKTEPNAKKGG
jgi:hypothetical protein